MPRIRRFTFFTRFVRYLRSSFKTILPVSSYRAAVVLILSFCLTGCGGSDPETQKQFDAFLSDCFQEYVTADTVTLHFKLSDPSAFGITAEEPASYGDFSLEKQQENCQRSAELLEELRSFDPDSLSEEDAFTWQIFEEALEASVASEDFLLFQSPFGANGMQSQIPVTLSEYYFDDEKDIVNYLALVNQIPELFDQLLAFENARRDAGIVSPDFVIENTIDQIEQFLSASEDDNLLIETFEEKIENVPDLGKDQKQTYINNNRSLVRQVVLPAFTSLRDSLENYQEAGTDTSAADNSSGSSRPAGQENDPGRTDAGRERLCQYYGGREYYELLLSANVGTDKSPEQCIDALEGTLKDTVSDIASLTRENADLYTEYLSARPLLTDSQQILTELENDTLIDFPEPPDVAYTLKNVPDALSSTSASAFYLLPPVDSEDANIIYLNQSRVSPEDQFSTLAHEGYPGHLYQTNYYLSTDPEPLRSMLRCDGYDEGWGTYAQLYSYNYLEFAGVSRETESLLQQLYRDNDILSLSLAALSDLYVNYENYTPEALAEYLSAYGVTAEGARSLYEYVIENPTTYLSYSIGWYELEQLRNTMEEELGSRFDVQEFHEAVLTCGSCSFPLLKERVSSAITE